MSSSGAVEYLSGWTDHISITSARLAIVGSIGQFQNDEGETLLVAGASSGLTVTPPQVFAISCLVASCWAAPAADAEADPQYLLGAHAAVAPVAPVAYHAGNCETVVETLITQTCTPTAENVCTTQTVETEEIEYEKVCKEVTDVICDGPAHYIAKREADAEAEADPQLWGAPYHHAALAAPVAAHAVAHSLKATVKHACREVVTEHCVSTEASPLSPPSYLIFF